MTVAVMTDIAIEMQGVGKSFPADRPGSPPVLQSVDLAIRHNEFVVLLGRSESGS